MLLTNFNNFKGTLHVPFLNKATQHEFSFFFQLTVCVARRHPPPSASISPGVVASAPPAVRGGRPAGGRGGGRGEAADAEGLGGADEAGQLGWGEKDGKSVWVLF